MNIQAYRDPSAISAGESARIAALLAVSDADEMSDVALANRVAEGFRPDAETALKQFLAPRLALGTVIPEPTLRRARKDGSRLSREHSERLYELSRVLDTIGRVYRGDVDRAAAFLSRPHRLLGGDTPLTMAKSSSAGSDAVLNLLARIEGGVAL